MRHLLGPEIIPIKNKNLKDIAQLVNAECFCPYPCPGCCLHDNGNECIGDEFQEMLES